MTDGSGDPGSDDGEPDDRGTDDAGSDDRGTDDAGSDDRGPTGTDERLRRLHDHLDATAELPVERGASAYLGEAEAVARDLVERPADPAVVRERAGHVRDLLAEVEGTGNEEADEHVTEARELADELASGPAAG